MVEEVIHLERSQIPDSKVTSLSSFTTAWPRSWSRPRIRILPSSHFQCVPFHSGSSQYLSNTHTYFPLRNRRQQWIGTFQTLFSMMLLKSGMLTWHKTPLKSSRACHPHGNGWAEAACATSDDACPALLWGHKVNPMHRTLQNNALWGGHSSKLWPPPDPQPIAPVSQHWGSLSSCIDENIAKLELSSKLWMSPYRLPQTCRQSSTRQLLGSVHHESVLLSCLSSHSLAFAAAQQHHSGSASVRATWK